MDVSVIYVNWNSADEILGSVTTVQSCTASVAFEIIVVDNASADGVEQLTRDGIRLIQNDRNLGFGSACNIGARDAKGEFLLFLNPDTLLKNDLLGILSSFLRSHPAAGGAGAQVLEEDGRIHFGAGRSFPSIINEFLEHTTLTFRFPRGRFFGKPYYSYWDHNSTRPVDSLLGACMMFRHELFKDLGGFDPRFFLYYEETDLCKRFWDAGFPIYYVHTARLLHKGKLSTTKFYGDVNNMIYQYLTSASLYFKKHHGTNYARLWKGLVAFVYLCRFLLSRKSLLFSYCKWVWSLPAAEGVEDL